MSFAIFMACAVIYIACAAIGTFQPPVWRVRLFIVALPAAIAATVVQLLRAEWISAVVWLLIAVFAAFTVRLARGLREREKGRRSA